MRPLLEQIPRPFRWGFFVFAGLTFFLLAFRSAVPTYVAAEWREISARQEEEISDAVQGEFHHRVRRLARIAGRIADDTTLLAALTSNHVEELIYGYERLNSIEAGKSVSIDLLDAKGTPVAWQGRNATDDYSKLLNRDS
ncbi:MAG: hypothetical protein HYW57_08065, partial [Ignavibacteriales bacterium]|nr:hypothetical protein [Ignavibacteriales bacterium]